MTLEINAIDKKTSAPPSLIFLFHICLRIGLLSFGGGVTGWFYNEFVMRTGLVSEDDFASHLAIAQMLPGANVINLIICMGNDLRGLAGAAICCFAFILGPFFAVVALCYAYASLSQYWFFSPFCDGVAFAAIGLLGATCVHGIRRASHSLASLAVLLVTALLVGVVQAPLVPVVVCMVPVSIFIVRRAHRHGG